MPEQKSPVHWYLASVESGATHALCEHMDLRYADASLNRGALDTQEETIPVSLHSIRFQGPFRWLQDGQLSEVGAAACASLPGLYLWTVPLSAGHLVYYVGETGRPFAARFAEHAKHWLSGRYEICDPRKFALGERHPIWPGAFGRQRKTPAECEVAIGGFEPEVRDLERQIRIFLGPIVCERRVRCRIEAGLARHLFDQPGLIGQFQSPEVRYVRRRKDELPFECAFSSDAGVLGLPAKLEV